MLFQSMTRRIIGANRCAFAWMATRSPSRGVVKASMTTRASAFIVDNPYDGEVYAEVPLEDLHGVRRTVDELRRTQMEWANNTTIEKRMEICDMFLQYFEENAEEIARDITCQMGKPLSQARGEVRGVEERARQMMEYAPIALSEEDLSDNPKYGNKFEIKILREPVGIVMTLAPWNYPLLTAVNSIVPAVLAGNGVLLSHGPRAPLCSNHFAKAFDHAGAQGLVVPFFSSLDTVFDVIKHGLVDFVCFTGGVETGQAVYSAVGSSTFMDATLELGGNDAGYIAHDANLIAAIDTMVDGSFYNAGQSCCGIERAYVHESLYDDFVEGCHRLIRDSYKLGNPLDDSTTMGPMARADAIAGLENMVEDAVEKGAKVVIGGSPATDQFGKGRFFQPTLLTECDSSMLVMKEETFGPILGVQKVADENEAIKLMNDTRYGLTASIFTSDKNLAAKMADQLDVGTVFMNRADYLDPCLPWQGRKNTGKGLSLSRFGFNAFTKLKNHHFKLVL